MATKTEIQNLIDVNLADESDISAEAHREVENKFVDEFFPTTIQDSYGNPTNIFQLVSSLNDFNIKSKRIGNVVYVNGFISFPGAVIGNLFQIVDSDYLCENITVFNAFVIESGHIQAETLKLYISNNTITLCNPEYVVINKPYYFNFFYFIND